jgi:hypothetical protein
MLKLHLSEVRPGSRHETGTEPPFESQTLPVRREIKPSSPYHEALSAIVRLYRAAYDKGDAALAGRAERALAALMGNTQKHLRQGSEPPDPPSTVDARGGRAHDAEPEGTLRGLGPADPFGVTRTR